MRVTDKDPDQSLARISRVERHLGLVPARSSAQVVCGHILCPLAWICKTEKNLQHVKK